MIILGSLAQAVGAFWLAHVLTGVHTAPSWATTAWPLAVVGAGLAAVMAALNDQALRNVPPQEAGSASSALGMTQQVGAAMGVALIGGVFDAHTRTGSLTDLTHAFSVALVVVGVSYLSAGIAAGGFLKRR